MPVAERRRLARAAVAFAFGGQDGESVREPTSTPTVLQEEVLQELGDVTITKAKDLLRQRGEPGARLASRLGKLSKARNGCCHPDVGLLPAVRQLLAAGDGLGEQSVVEEAAAKEPEAEQVCEELADAKAANQLLVDKLAEAELRCEELAGAKAAHQVLVVKFADQGKLLTKEQDEVKKLGVKLGLRASEKEVFERLQVSQVAAVREASRAEGARAVLDDLWNMGAQSKRGLFASMQVLKAATAKHLDD